jgi:hypothetical protein
MNKKAMIEEVCQYVLDQKHEREDLIDRMYHNAKEWQKDGSSKAQIRAELKDQAPNSIFYIAMVLAHGKRAANQSYRGCIIEALEKL